MIVTTDRQGRWIGGIASVLFHLALLIFAAVVLLQPARYHVMPGKISTIDLVTVTAPPTPRAIARPTPPVPRASAPPSLVPPVPSLHLVKSAEPHPAQPDGVPVLPKLHPAKPAIAAHSAPAPSASSAGQGAVQAQPDELHNQPPIYPEASQEEHEEGMVMLRVSVTGSGRSARVAILKSSGYFRLDEAARRAVLHWRFHPALFAGIPVASLIDVPVRFQLQ
jgi:periplasmic protein TonB